MDQFLFRRRFASILPTVLSAFMMILPARAQDKTKPSVEEIPQSVMKGLTTQFPKAEIDKWTEEKEGEMMLYDIEFRQEGRKFEADIRADGSIHNWEKSIAAGDLPPQVSRAVNEKYPKSEMKEIMVITAVVNGEDKLEGYEVVLETVAGREVEVTIAGDGTILEDSGGSR